MCSYSQLPKELVFNGNKVSLHTQLLFYFLERVFIRAFLLAICNEMKSNETCKTDCFAFFLHSPSSRKEQRQRGTFPWNAAKDWEKWRIHGNTSDQRRLLDNQFHCYVSFPSSCSLFFPFILLRFTWPGKDSSEKVEEKGSCHDHDGDDDIIKKWRNKTSQSSTATTITLCPYCLV